MVFFVSRARAKTASAAKIRANKTRSHVYAASLGALNSFSILAGRTKGAVRLLIEY